MPTCWVERVATLVCVRLWIPRVLSVCARPIGGVLTASRCNQNPALVQRNAGQVLVPTCIGLLSADTYLR